uniref:EGF-like domain-containing protein n=1 Tax=Strongyloides venezuelensis TaxID=75913 RepID=A0A0K0EWB0_STRVS
MAKIVLLFLTILICLITLNHNVLSKKNSKKKTTKKKPSSSSSSSLSMNKTIEYYIGSSLDYRYYEPLINGMGQETCLKFVKTKNFSATNVIIITKDNSNSVSAKIKDGKILYSIFIKELEFNVREFHKLLYWILYIRYKFNECVGNKQGQIKEKTMKELLKNYKCNLESISETTVKVEENSISYSYKKVKKLGNISPENLDQLDYSKIFFFSDLIDLNQKICKDSCKKSKTKCKNFGILNPNSCSRCICPYFYEGDKCENTIKRKKPEICGNVDLKAQKKTQVKNMILDPRYQCLYKIKPTSKNAKVEVKFEPPTKAYIRCHPGYFEINYYNDKSKTGVSPCKYLEPFTIKGSKGATVFVYSTNLFNPPFSNMTMKYKEIKA